MMGSCMAGSWQQLGKLVMSELDIKREIIQKEDFLKLLGVNRLTFKKMISLNAEPPQWGTYNS